jgi:hypothetical protein
MTRRSLWLHFALLVTLQSAVVSVSRLKCSLASKCCTRDQNDREYY